MRKNRLFALLPGLLLSGLLAAQETETETEKAKAPKMDRVVLDLNWETWQGGPDSVKLAATSRGVNLNLLYDISLGKGNFALGIGLGFSSHNYYHDAAVAWVNEADHSQWENYNDDSLYTVLVPFPDGYNYKKNKLSVNYLDVPFELRLRTNENPSGKRWKFAVGAKLGYLVNIHSKTIDDDGKHKFFIFPNANPFRYGASARIGYGKVGLSAFYSLSSIFEENKGVALTPLSIGISITPY